MCLCVVNKFNEDIAMLPGSILVCVYLMRGEYDDRLVWPFRGEITTQLVNQINDQKHQEETFRFDGKSSIFSCNRVTSGERAKSGCEGQAFTIMNFKNTMYIKDDCVKFRVTKVVVAS